MAKGRWKATFSRRPLETVAEAQRKAKRHLPRPVYMSLLAGTDKGLTLKENLDAFDQIGFRARVGTHLPMKREMATRALGVDLSMPVVLSPAGVQAVRPGGEVPVAKAARAMGLALGQSNFGSSRFEDVVAANPDAFFQLYWVGRKDQIAYRIDRAKKAGARGLIMTLDATPYARKDWGSPSVPARVDLPAMVRHAPMGLSRPAWLMDFFLHGGLPDLRIPNFEAPDRPAPTFTEAFVDWLATPFPTWDDVRWVADQWGGTFMVKGVLTPEDARRAVEAGATAISVSNHGGNNLDGTPSALRALPAVARAVGRDAEVLYDGGVRRGSDVVKAVALGAKAVMVGRVWLFGLAARGERGVREVLEILRDGIDKTLVSIGRASIHDVVAEEDLFIPSDFELFPPEGKPQRWQPYQPIPPTLSAEQQATH